MTFHGKSAVSTPNAPAAIGPYSQAVQTGEMIYASGQVPLDPATGNMVDGGIREQTVRVLENLQAVLAAAGSSLQQVVKTTVFLKDMNNFAQMNEEYGKFFPANPPARTTVEVARLPRDVQIEIEGIALDTTQ